MVRIWMLITFAIIVIWIALAWGQLAAFFNQAKPALSPVGLTMSVDGGKAGLAPGRVGAFLFAPWPPHSR